MRAVAMENSTLFGSIAACIVLPAAFAYWITDVPAPARKAADARVASPSVPAQRGPLPSAVIPAAAAKTEAFAFSPANPFGAAAAPRSAVSPATPTPAQPQGKVVPQAVVVASDNDPANGN